MTVRFDHAEVLKATAATCVGGQGDFIYQGVCTDSRQLTPGCLFVALKGERFDGHEFALAAAQGGAAGVMVQEGWPQDRLSGLGTRVYIVPDTLRALGQLAHLHRKRFSIPLGAVTGSNGKTTTKEMVASILSVRGPVLKTLGNLNNEVGVPLTLFGLSSQHVAAIVEMGMNHLGEISRLTQMAAPDAGLITVVQPAHLEGVGSLDGVATAKTELFRELAPTGTAVVNIDDPLIVAKSQGLSARRLTFGKALGADVRLVEIAPRGSEGMLLRIAARGAVHSVPLPLVGEHNALNATGAFALALALGYSPDECVAGLSTTKPPAGRLTLLPGPAGSTIIDDCYNANPESMRAGLRTAKQLAHVGRPMAVLGDMLELGAAEDEAHAQVCAEAAASMSVLALFGPRMKKAAGALGAQGRHFDDIEALVRWVAEQLQSGDVVLVKGSRGMRLERVVDQLTHRTSSGSH